MTDEPVSSTPNDPEPSKPTAADLLARLAFPSGVSSSQVRDAIANFGLSDPKLGDALREFVNGPALTGLKGLDTTAFESIRQAANANNRLMLEGLSTARVEVPEIPPFEPVRSAEEVLLDGLREDMADLRTITAGQATNVALQAQLAGAQTGKLDELIAAIHEATTTTEKLERTAITIARVALFISIVVAIPVVYQIVQTITGVIQSLL